MKASALEFRFRMLIILLIVLLGFLAPWGRYLHLGRLTTTWLWLGFQLGGLGLTSTAGIQIATGLTIAVAALAAALRVWGTAYLGTSTVNNAEMKAGQVMADGPYRYVRNPLYLGTWLMIAAISTLMSPSGAAVTLVLLAIFLFRLILGEEAFLARQLGESYLAYKKSVPRLLPSLRARVARGGRSPRWSFALLSEISALGIFVSFAALSWQYNAQLLDQAVLVSFGISLVTRALLQNNSGTQQAIG
ncbi:methyltransferase family protein [Acidicapsa ligni]|uniref:methyltransferase family protein n=1 Tax=Acidicapsa ligni TaxID=542300 RepID=UPI0021DFCB4B|nr:isoprenylcysteine carboxylmethyltransferase family protein [Acidicapsa ligni]